MRSQRDSAVQDASAVKIKNSGIYIYKVFVKKEETGFLLVWMRNTYLIHHNKR